MLDSAVCVTVSVLVCLCEWADEIDSVDASSADVGSTDEVANSLSVVIVEELGLDSLLPSVLAVTVTCIVWDGTVCVTTSPPLSPALSTAVVDVEAAVVFEDSLVEIGEALDDSEVKTVEEGEGEAVEAARVELPLSGRDPKMAVTVVLS